MGDDWCQDRCVRLTSTVSIADLLCPVVEACSDASGANSVLCGLTKRISDSAAGLRDRATGINLSERQHLEPRGRADQ